MRLRVGFTGTRAGMSAAQRTQLVFMLAAMGRQGVIHEFHYGTHETVRLLADEQAAEIAKAQGYTPVPHHAMPGGELARDTAQVAVVDVLLAAPLQDAEVLRSGTWATVRRARKRKIPCAMLARGA